MQKTLCWIIFFLSIIPVKLYAHINPVENEKHSLSFIANQGQWDASIHYKALIKGGAVFLTPQGFAYNFYSTQDLKRIHDLKLKNPQKALQQKIQKHAYQIDLLGANLENNIAENPKPYYHNYFLGNDPSQWKSKVPLYEKIIYKEVYAGIDMWVYSEKGNLKYDFILKNGAQAEHIKMSFKGVAPVITAKGELKIATAVGDIIESVPYTYQIINNQKIEVACKYIRVGENVFSFQPGSYDPRYPLVIDPVLVFATYSGSTAETYACTATYNELGELLEAGECYDVGFPVTTGAYQSVFGGETDIAINKFNATGTTLQHSTYIGGDSTEQPASIICDVNMDLYLLGSTNSNNFPVTTGCYDNTKNGGIDIVVMHIDSGFSSLKGSTYIGGTNDDGLLYPKCEIYLNDLNHIYYVSYTNSHDYPVTAGAYQTGFGGKLDGVVTIVNNDCSKLVASTFLGGQDDDRITGIRKLSNGNVSVVGASKSSNYPTTANVYQTTGNTGQENGVISILTGDLKNMVASTYVHAPNTTSNTSLILLDLDKEENIYVSGITDVSFPVSAGKYSNVFGKTLLAKFKPDLSGITWSTRIGSNTQPASDAITPSAFLIDDCQKIYLTGFSFFAIDYPLTGDAFSTTPAGFWNGIFDAGAGSLLFGSYFGTAGDHLDGGVSRYNKKGVVYHAVCNGNSFFPVTSNAAFTSNTTGSFDMVGYKIDNQAPIVAASFGMSPGWQSCTMPFGVSFHNYSMNATSYYWDFGDGGTATGMNPFHNFTTPGKYNVMLVASNPLACNLHDTFYLPVQILDNNLQLVNDDTTICFPDGLQPVELTARSINGSENITYHWLPNNAIIGTSDTQTITIDPSKDSIFIAVVIDSIQGLCAISDTDTVRINIIDPSNYYALPDTTILFCKGASFQLYATGGTSSTYLWSEVNGNNNTILLPESATPVITPLGTTSYIVDIYSPDKTCFISDTVFVEVQKALDIETVSPLQICKNDTIMLEAYVLKDIAATTIIWKDIDNSPAKDMISGANTLNPIVAPSESRTYIIEINPDDTSCVGRDTIEVLVYPSVNLDAGEDKIIRFGETVQLFAEGTGSFLWTPATYLDRNDIQNPITHTPENITYVVSTVTTEGCKEIDSVNIKVTQLSFPTAFTPNNDGLNDRLKLIVANDYVQLEEIIIMDRWGQPVYKSKIIDDGWDGTYDGVKAEIGVYFYYIKYKIGNKSYMDKGDVSLIR